jgi:TetR/AcrR family transcriptional regulator, mexJK operon transcriptional repressor
MTKKLPGRPPDHGKSAAMVAAAATVFFERGFADTTVEAVADRAGVSKVTIYARFGDKAGLFEAMVKHVSERMQADAAPQGKLSSNIEDALISFGNGVMTELLSQRLVAFERNLAGELSRHPDLARRFYEAGPGQCRIRLAAIIKDAADKGELMVEHPLQAAADLYGLWHGFHMIEARFGMTEPPTEQEIDDLVKTGVARFLRAYRP